MRAVSAILTELGNEHVMNPAIEAAEAMLRLEFLLSSKDCSPNIRRTRTSNVRLNHVEVCKLRPNPRLKSDGENARREARFFATAQRRSVK
ncbi:MAG TPA: hypothetical protein VF452_02225, partial [Candidatus Binatia bacterium]